MLQLLPQGIQQRSGQATLTRFGGTTTQQTGITYPQSVTRAAEWVGRLPPNAGSDNSIRVKLAWVSTAATTGAVKWDVSFEDLETPHDWTTDGFATAQTTTQTVSGTVSTLNVAELTFTFTQADNLAAEDMFRIRVERDGADVADTMAVDAYLANITLELFNSP
jgi:hypothetical protein